MDLIQRILPEDLFLGLLCLERKRAERSGKKFLLLLLDIRAARGTDRQTRVLEGVIKAADVARRETDPAGWYKNEAVLGILFTELGAVCDAAIIDTILEKVQRELFTVLSSDELRLVHVTAHVFADDSKDDDWDIPENSAFYPDLFHHSDARKMPLLLKRMMDIVGSAFALLLLSPLFALVAVMVRLTSKGPVLFRQERVGQFGVPFQFLKFRSMQVSSDAAIHEEYVKKFISGKADLNSSSGNNKKDVVYKITNDPRVTWIGRILRRTSLDELPQFWNVLRGQMSLVGPRPPVPYEFEAYDLWHRRRLLEVKPGITGLWQVKGRSKTTFDEMVRLDLRYSRTWTPLLDVKILLQTPRAVFSGDGAY
jgi:lipopolysaccharide/colanic/teichoic acid biosynthesis glycosyltransferase